MCESEPLTLYVVYTAKPGCREAFVRQIVMEGIADTIRREAGCIRYDYYFSAQQEDEILLVEQWHMTPQAAAGCGGLCCFVRKENTHAV